MSGETVEVWGTPKPLETNGLGFTNGSIIQVSSIYEKGVDANWYPDAQFTLVLAFGAAPVENSLISLYAREYSMDGVTGRIDLPEASRPGRMVGSFLVNDRTLSQTLILMAYDLPAKADYYLHNNGTGQGVSNGWKLTVVPRTYGPRP